MSDTTADPHGPDATEQPAGPTPRPTGIAPNASPVPGLRPADGPAQYSPFPREVATGPPAEPRELGWRFVAAVAAGAVAADLAMRTIPWNNVAASIGVIVVVGALLASGRIVNRSAVVALGLAAILGSFLWLRTDPTLITFNLLTISALLWYSVISARGRSMWDVGPFRLALRAGDTIVLTIESMIDVVVEIGARQRRARESGALASEVGAGIVRGAAIAIPVLLVLGLLLASADAVFASFFDIGFGVSINSLIGHAMLLLVGAFAMVLLLRLAGRSLVRDDEPTTERQLGRVEALVVLVGLNTLFAAFAVAQVIALTGGADRVLGNAGLTFKEYARQGFFQLLWVAGITLVVLVALNTLTRRHDAAHRKPIVIASLVSVALTLMIVVVAFTRLRLYYVDDGFTPLRFYSSVFSVWIGVVFVLLALRVIGRWGDRSWLTTAIGLSGVVMLIGLNLVSPEAIIAKDNLDRNEWSITYHMHKLTADGEVVLFDGLDRLSPDIREEVREYLCGPSFSDIDFDRTGLGYNLSERRLDERIAEHCQTES